MENQEINSSAKILYVKLNKSQYQLLSGLFLSRLIDENHKYYLTGDKEYLNLVLDKLSDILMKDGLNPDDTPNEMGLKIESLIDRINHYIL